MKVNALTIGLVAIASLIGAGEVRGAGPPRPVTEADVGPGKQVYLRECSACHGERGGGDGAAAVHLEVRPRNFLRASFKFKTSPDGVRTDDLLAVLERGIPGSAMPSFKFLSPKERQQVAAYVLYLGDLLEEEEPAPAPTSTPPPTTPETIARGKVVYEEQLCGSCHGPGGKGDGKSAKGMKDSDGFPIKVRDLTLGGFRGGSRPVDLYLRFTLGLDGTPMPAYGDNVNEPDRWALVDFIRSLEVPQKPVVYPKDPIKAGRQVAAVYGCRGCHVLDDGKGGDVGPDLRLSAQKLQPDWIRGFLAAPRAVGKIYPWRPHRMPELGLQPPEVEVLTAYLGKMGKRKGTPSTPALAQLVTDDVNAGKVLYMVRCTECHNLGKVVETPVIKQQGPDLIRVAERIDYTWAQRWITDPKKIDPNTKMTVPGLSPKEVDQVRAFVWWSSLTELGKTAAR